MKRSLFFGTLWVEAFTLKGSSNELASRVHVPEAVSICRGWERVLEISQKVARYLEVGGEGENWRKSRAESTGQDQLEGFAFEGGDPFGRKASGRFWCLGKDPGHHCASSSCSSAWHREKTETGVRAETKPGEEAGRGKTRAKFHVSAWQANPECLRFSRRQVPLHVFQGWVLDLLVLGAEIAEGFVYVCRSYRCCFHLGRYCSAAIADQWLCWWPGEVLGGRSCTSQATNCDFAQEYLGAWRPCEGAEMVPLWWGIFWATLCQRLRKAGVKACSDCCLACKSSRGSKTVAWDQGPSGQSKWPGMGWRWKIEAFLSPWQWLCWRLVGGGTRVVDEDNQAAQCGNLFFDPYPWCVDAGNSVAWQDLQSSGCFTACYRNPSDIWVESPPECCGSLGGFSGPENWDRGPGRWQGCSWRDACQRHARGRVRS